MSDQTELWGAVVRVPVSVCAMSLYGLPVHRISEQPVIWILSELLTSPAQVLPLEIVSWQQH